MLYNLSQALRLEDSQDNDLGPTHLKMQENMQTVGREEQVKAMIAERLACAKELLKDHKVFLYGSRARGTARPTSDFDIGIWGENPLPLVAFYQLEDMLEALPTLYKIDLVDLKRTSEKFQQHAFEKSEELLI